MALRGQPKTALAVIAAAGGEMDSLAFYTALEQAHPDSNRNVMGTTLWGLKKRGYVRYKGAAGGKPFPIKLTAKGMLEAPEQAANTDPRAGQLTPVPAAVVRSSKPTVAQLEAPADGVAVLFHPERGQVAMWVDGGKRKDFTASEFGKTAAFFSMLAGK